MVPTYLKASTGRSSASPSMMALNDFTVSSRLTKIPGMPVKASATWNGCEQKF